MVWIHILLWCQGGGHHHFSHKIDKFYFISGYHFDRNNLYPCSYYIIAKIPCLSSAPNKFRKSPDWFAFSKTSLTKIARVWVHKQLFGFVSVGFHLWRYRNAKSNGGHDHDNIASFCRNFWRNCAIFSLQTENKRLDSNWFFYGDQINFWISRRSLCILFIGKKKNFDNAINQMSYEQLRDPYEGDFDEYLEIWIQFGYVCLFTSIYEYAPVCALLATIIEIRNDAHKFCNLFQRPEEWNFKIIQLCLLRTLKFFLVWDKFQKVENFRKYWSLGRRIFSFSFFIYPYSSWPDGYAK